MYYINVRTYEFLFVLMLFVDCCYVCFDIYSIVWVTKYAYSHSIIAKNLFYLLLFRSVCLLSFIWYSICTIIHLYVIQLIHVPYISAQKKKNNFKMRRTKKPENIEFRWSVISGRGWNKAYCFIFIFYSSFIYSLSTYNYCSFSVLFAFL